MTGRIYRTSGNTVVENKCQSNVPYKEREDLQIEYHSLEDLRNVADEYASELVLRLTKTGFDIEIYDDYRE